MLKPDKDKYTRRVQRQYDRWAGVYDWLWQRYTDRTLSVLEAAVRVRPGERVLDVGCGTGAFEARQADTGATLVGVDVSTQMLAHARRKLRGAPNVAFCQAEACSLPFPDARFDGVVNASAFHYFDDPHAALREMRRVLTPGGRVVLLDWCRDYLTCRLCDVVLKRLDPAYQTCYTQAELHGLLRAAGFAICQGRRFRVGLAWGMMVAEATPAAPRTKRCPTLRIRQGPD